MLSGEHEFLGKRHAVARQIMLGAAALAALALLIRGVLISPSIGIEGVAVSSHVPGHRLANQHLSLIWTGAGWIQLALTAIVQVVATILPLVIIWALIKRRSRIALYSIALAVFLALFAPVPTVMQPTPPKAMSVMDAAVFVRDTSNFHPRDPISQRYMAAQVAYLKGDKSRARQLSEGLTARALASPIEAKYRLQFLQGRKPEMSNVCFKPLICLKQDTLGKARITAMLAFILALIVALCAFWLCRIFKARIERIGALQGQLRLRALRS
jgi:hypothetical protein